MSNSGKAVKVTLQGLSVLLFWKKYLIVLWLLLAAFLITVMIGVLAMIMAGGNSSTGEITFTGGTANVSAEVLQHQPLVEKYASQYGISEYVGIMLALMQQESGGRGNDPMQSSESFCGSIGCISDIETSIDKGVLHFKSVLEKANYDLNLTLQSYNFGGGFIDWINKRGGKYTKELAIEFSQYMMTKVSDPWNYTCIRQEAKPLGACYGDIMYVEAVMKYYTGGLDGTIEVGGSGAAKKAAEVGMKWIGKTTYHWGGGRNEASAARGEFDCSSFVRWAYAEAGVNLAPIHSVNTDVLKHKGVKISVSDIKVGDMIFWDTYKKDGHVGIYIGNGKWIGSQSSSGVAIEEMSNTYWTEHFSGHVRRVIQ